MTWTWRGARGASCRALVGPALAPRATAAPDRRSGVLRSTPSAADGPANRSRRSARRIRICRWTEPDEFDALATRWPMVPVWTELLADVSTPVGLFPALAGDGPGLILESVERSERWGRYSFVAGDPAAVVVVDADGVRIEHVVRPAPDSMTLRAGDEPREALIAIARSLAGPRPADLPPLTGGLMGYLAYEAATLSTGTRRPSLATRRVHRSACW